MIYDFATIQQTTKLFVSLFFLFSEGANCLIVNRLLNYPKCTVVEIYQLNCESSILRRQSASKVTAQQLWQNLWSSKLIFQCIQKSLFSRISRDVCDFSKFFIYIWEHLFIFILASTLPPLPARLFHSNVWWLIDKYSDDS